MKDGDIFRSWYRAGADRDQSAAYAESDDGIHWRRPNLGMVEYDGSTDNNIFLKDDDLTNFAVFRDDNPSVPDEERYKAIAKGAKQDGRTTIRGLSSPDGLWWKIIEVDPILLAPDDGWPCSTLRMWRTGMRYKGSTWRTCVAGSTPMAGSPPITP